MEHSLHDAGSGKNFENARLHRRKATETEAVLWQMLRNRKFCGYKFRRQHPIQSYIADFYCHELKLVIELDGGYHNTEEQKALDLERDCILRERGIYSLRITNEELLHNTDQCLQSLSIRIVEIRNTK